MSMITIGRTLWIDRKRPGSASIVIVVIAYAF